MNKGINLVVPFFSQRSNRYIEGDRSFAADTCNLTSLCMVLHYLGITDDTPDVLIRKFLAEGYEESDPYTYWKNLKQCCTDLYGVDQAALLYGEEDSAFSHTRLPRYLEAGLPVLFSFGILWPNATPQNGHIAVLRGMTKDGNWILNDPWGDPANPWGLLNNEAGRVPGVYVARTAFSDAVAGKGSGDNAILGKSEAEKVCADPLASALCILWTRQWCFFLRDENGKRIRYGDASAEEITAQAMSALGSDFSFILGQNGTVKYGIDFSAACGKTLYSCGPGRIIAIRNTPGTVDNFILVMHELPKNRTKKVFMLYKGLAYIDLQKEIQKKLYVSENYAASWYEQLIQKIHPKAVIYDEGKLAANRIHDGTGLPERGIAYLVPYQDGEFKRFLENIQPGENLENTAYLRADDTSQYTSADGKSIKIYLNGTEKTAASDSMHLVPQAVNVPEYRYYRKKIAQLMTGEAVIFAGEDDNTIADRESKDVMKEDYQSFFVSAANDIFPETSGERPVLGEALEDAYRNRLDKVCLYYIWRLQSECDEKKCEEIGDEFVYRCETLCRRLLETPWSIRNSAFTLNDKWFERIYELFQTVKLQYDFGMTWALFEERVRYFYPTNMDFYLEATSGSVLGTATQYTSVQCFSVEDLSREHSSLNMDVIQIKNPYDKKNVVFELSSCRYITPEYFDRLPFLYVTLAEVEDFHRVFPLKDLNYGVCTPNPFRGQPRTGMLDTAYGNREIKQENRNDVKLETLLSNDLKKILKDEYGINLSAEKLYFYNPVKIISAFFEMHEKQIQKLRT